MPDIQTFPTSSDEFSYGSTTLGYARTVRLSEEPVFDPSGVDYLFTRVRLAVAGVLAYGSLNVPPATGGEKPADVARRIEHALMTPRQRLRYRLAGRVVFAVDPPPKTGLAASTPADEQVGAKLVVDADHGPKPVSLSFPLMVEGGINVEFEIEFHIVTCSAAASVGQQRGYASNRFETKEEFNELGYRTVRTSGVMIGRSDIPGNLDQFRSKVVPAVPNGYQRVGSTWTLSPDGLRLAYEFSDKELYLTPPEPAKKCGGRLLVASNNAGATYVGQLNLWLEGPKTVTKAALLTKALSIASSVLGRFMVRGENQRSPMAQLSIGTDLWENRVEVSGRVTLDAKKIQFVVGTDNPSLEIFVQDIPGSPKENQPPVAPPIRGMFPLMELIAAEYNDPCVIQSLVNATGTTPQGVEYPKAGTNPASVAQGPVSTPTTTPTTEVPYDTYLISVRYDTDSGKRVLWGSAPGVLHPVVQPYQPTLDLEVSWTAERTGQTPDIPDPCPPPETKVKDPLRGGVLVDNFVLTTQRIQTEQITRVAGGAFRHVITGVYRYSVRSPCVVPLIEPLVPFLVQEVKGTQPTGSPASIVANGRSITNAYAVPQATPGQAAMTQPWIPGLTGPGQLPGFPGSGGTTAPPPPPPLTAQQQADAIAAQLGQKPNPAIPPPTPPGNQPVFRLNPDLVWFRLRTVKPANEILCANCDGKGFTGELGGNPNGNAAGIARTVP